MEGRGLLGDPQLVLSHSRPLAEGGFQSGRVWQGGTISRQIQFEGRSLRHASNLFYF